jgi:hypothetical protein
MGALLVTCGVLLAAIGTWSGYRNARAAIMSAIPAGDPTRTAIDAARPLHARTAVRRFARSVAVSLGWLALALYGLFLASAGSALGGPP